jgi:hypothetical protein
MRRKFSVKLKESVPIIPGAAQDGCASDHYAFCVLKDKDLKPKTSSHGSHYKLRYRK